MTTETTQHTFSAPVKSLGRQQRGDGWDLVLGWRLPGSKYDLHLYGQEWADVSGFNIGYAATWTIQRGNLKNEKDGKYASDYHWNWDQQAAPTDVDEQFAGKPEPGQEPSERTNAGIAVEGVIQGHLEKLAVDLLLGEQSQGYIAIAAPIEMWQIREKRDLLFHELKSIPIQEPYWCHQHDTRRKQSPAGTYAHPHTDGDQNVFCTPYGLVDGTGALVNGPAENKPTDDLPF